MHTPEWWSNAEPSAHDALNTFGEKVRDKLAASPKQIIGRKNPFLFRARTVNGAEELADSIISAYLSSSEETMFGNALEEIAVAICTAAKGGWKSGIESIDLEYDSSVNTRTIVQIKSGPNWGNSSQKQKLLDSFRKATTVLRQGTNLQVRQIEGICYGRAQVKDLGSHLRITGASFWEEISGWEGTAKGVLAMVGNHASNGLRELRIDAVKAMVRYFQEHDAATKDNRTMWDRLYDLVS